jgi:hypothetical protein
VPRFMMLRNTRTGIQQTGIRTLGSQLLHRSTPILIDHSAPVKAMGKATHLGRDHAGQIAPPFLDHRSCSGRSASRSHVPDRFWRAITVPTTLDSIHGTERGPKGWTHVGKALRGRRTGAFKRVDLTTNSTPDLRLCEALLRWRCPAARMLAASVWESSKNQQFVLR